MCHSVYVVQYIYVKISMPGCYQRKLFVARALLKKTTLLYTHLAVAILQASLTFVRMSACVRMKGFRPLRI